MLHAPLRAADRIRDGSLPINFLPKRSNSRRSFGRAWSKGRPHLPAEISDSTTEIRVPVSFRESFTVARGKERVTNAASVLF